MTIQEPTDPGETNPGGPTEPSGSDGGTTTPPTTGETNPGGPTEPSGSDGGTTTPPPPTTGETTPGEPTQPPSGGDGGTTPPPPAVRQPPKRLAVIMALQSLLAQISKADGDYFDLAGKVVRNRVLLGADINERPPLVAIVEAPRPDIALFAGNESEARKDLWTIMIQGIAFDDRKGGSDDVYYLAQDVERRLHRIQAEKAQSGNPVYPDDHLLGGMITSVEIAPPVIRPPEAGVANNAFFYLPIRLGMAMKIGE